MWSHWPETTLALSIPVPVLWLQSPAALHHITKLVVFLFLESQKVCTLWVGFAQEEDQWVNSNKYPLSTLSPRAWSFKKKVIKETSLVVQWLRLCMSTAEAADSTPGPGTGIPQAVTQPENFKKTFFKKVMKQDPSPQESVFVHRRPVHLGVDRVKEVLPIYLFFPVFNWFGLMDRYKGKNSFGENKCLSVLPPGSFLFFLSKLLIF